MPKNSKNKEIFQITNFLQFDVIVEPFRARKKVTQCYKCQNFFHIAKNCFATPRCVKCGGSHVHAECELKKTENSLATCCNCGLNHPSSYRGCKKFPSLPPTRKEKFSYADALKSNANGRPRSPPPNDSTSIENSILSQNSNNNDLKFLSECNSLKDVINDIKSQLKIKNFSEILIKLQNIAKAMKTVNSHQDKLFCFLDGLTN